MMREIKGTQRLPRLLAIRLDGTGTVSLLEGAGDATVADTGTGDWLITFRKPFARIPVVIPATKTAESTVRCVVTATTIQVLGFAVDQTTPKDIDADLMVLGWDTPDQY